MQEDEKMEREEMKTKLEEAVKDEVFVRKLADAKSPEEAQEIFLSKGLDFSLDEVKAIGRSLENEGSELDDDELENVSGGCGWVVVAAFGILAYSIYKYKKSPHYW